MKGQQDKTCETRYQQTRGNSCDVRKGVKLKNSQNETMCAVCKFTLALKSMSAGKWRGAHTKNRKCQGHPTACKWNTWGIQPGIDILPVVLALQNSTKFSQTKMCPRLTLGKKRKIINILVIISVLNRLLELCSDKICFQRKNLYKKFKGTEGGVSWKKDSEVNYFWSEVLLNCSEQWSSYQE